MKMTTVTNEWRHMNVAIACVNPELKDSVTAWVYGCFALHQSLFEGDLMWVITHIPTGRRIHFYPEAGYRQIEIATLIVKMHDRYGDEWNTDSTNKARSMAVACKDIWQIETAVQS